MGPPSYMWSVVDRNVAMRRIPVMKVLSDQYLVQFKKTDRSVDRKVKMSYKLVHKV
jgi:hypothetical protein